MKRCSLLFKFALPTVVMPASPLNRKKQATPSVSVSDSDGADDSRARVREDDRVLELGNRVRSVLSHQQQPSPSMSSQTQSGDEDLSHLDAVSQMMNRQQKEREDAENLLRGLPQQQQQQQPQNATVENLSPELAWAQRILNQQQQQQQQKAGSPSGSSAVDPATEKRAAMLKFLEMQSSIGAAEPKASSAASSSKKIDGEALLRQLRGGSSGSPPLSEEQQSQLVDWIDGFVPRMTASAALAKNPTAEQQREEEETKQINFSHALRDVAALLDRSGFQRKEWFLACGTALGCIREKGRFISHDTDIDIGIFYNDKESFSDCMFRLLSSTSPAMLTIQQELQLVCFDTLGEMHPRGTGEGGGGFQLRLMHAPSRVLIDINVHYPGTGKQEDSYRQRVDDSGWWFAMFYIDPKSGRYDPAAAEGMRRCWFSSAALSPDNTSSSDLSVAMLNIGWRKNAGAQLEVRCPNEQYLLEYFGSDWRIPRQYDYATALEQGLFKNLK